MNSPEGRLKAITVTSILLLLGAVGWGTFEARKYSALEADFNEEKLKHELLYSEKLTLEKELGSNNQQIAALLKKRQELEEALAKARERDPNSDVLARLRNENSLAQKKYRELESAKQRLEQQLAELNNTLVQAQSENKELNATLASLQQTNKNLNEELSRAQLAYYDRVMVESLRGKNDKLVAKASRTRKIRANVWVPANLRDVQFKVIDPHGDVLSKPEGGTLAVRVVNKGEAVTSAGKSLLGGYQEIEMIFLPKKKLQPGIYQIEVTSENLVVGSLKQRLR
jgi:DNA repair exonuclease SbcCD ATPase subunit